MKLWHISQWGNPKDGHNGWDTQCIITAPTLEDAIQFGQKRIQDHNGDYRNGKADAIYLMGDDGHPDGEPKLVVRVWIAFADNLAHNPSWFRKYWEGDGNQWGTHQEIYGD